MNDKIKIPRDGGRPRGIVRRKGERRETGSELYDGFIFQPGLFDQCFNQVQHFAIGDLAVRSDFLAFQNSSDYQFDNIRTHDITPTLSFCCFCCQ